MGVDIGLFHEMAKNNGSPKKVTELSAALKGFNVDVLRKAPTPVVPGSESLQACSDQTFPPLNRPSPQTPSSHGPDRPDGPG